MLTLLSTLAVRVDPQIQKRPSLGSRAPVVPGDSRTASYGAEAIEGQFKVHIKTKGLLTVNLSGFELEYHSWIRAL